MPQELNSFDALPFEVLNKLINCFLKKNLVDEQKKKLSLTWSVYQKTEFLILTHLPNDICPVLKKKAISLSTAAIS